MALNLYRATVNGYETVLQLDEADAKTRGLGSKDLYKGEPAAPAASTPDSAAADAAAAEKAAAAPANKARAAAANK